MQVSLARAPLPSGKPALPLLAARGARVILGARPALPAAPIAPTASTLFGPRGACLATAAGPLIACDTGHHRLLIWNQVPTTDNAPADLLIGQPHFEAEGRNAKRDIGPATLNVPTGIAVANGVLAIADAWNHRVLLWHGLPRASNQPADIVLGQADFQSGFANRGGNARADTLNWPYGVTLHDGRLYVADTGNRRVLVWDAMPESNGAPADRIINDAMSWPHALAAAGDRLFVADAGACRVWVVGACAISSEIGMPYGVTIHEHRVIVADTANSRLLGFDLRGGAPQWLAGQRGFGEKGENRWAFPERDSLCWPYGLSTCGNLFVIADTGNNRLLLWEAA